LEDTVLGGLVEKVYDPGSVEGKWYSFWIEKGYFVASVSSSKPPFSIVIPPPNVTGSLHMGHALNNVLQDVVVRFKRMDGFEALWVPGTDHAGIATQNVVERELAKEGLSRDMLGREAFVERVWQWRERYGRIIVEQLKRLGCSCDWSKERFTMDEGLSRAVREVFVRLYEEGLIYRANYIINFCPRCRTALSDLEVEHEEEEGRLYYIRYPLDGTEGFLTVATTRPETMLGDTALAVNPSDERYRAYLGLKAILPIIGRRLPIISDSYVDPSFGTGVLKVTPAHDFNDFEIAKRHGLEAIRIMDEDGRISDRGGPYAGMDRFLCRERILQDLEEEGLLDRIEPYRLLIGRCYRCKSIVEPFLSLQWFLRMKPLAEPAIEAVRQGRVKIIPKVWEQIYFEWMENIRDWCISRQIWWGHRIPVFYCDSCGAVLALRQDLKECKACGGPLRQDEDVLDTWFSSALWPFSTLGWPEQTDLLRKFYPTSLLVTGFDILFFWVARMTMMGLKFMGEVPFREVYIHALVRDEKGKKMSKSRGNVIDPLRMIERYGTDAFRFTLAQLSVQGRDILLSERRIEGGRNFANKVWNAGRLTLSLLEDFSPKGVTSREFLPDAWVLSRLQSIVEAVRDGIEGFRFSEAASDLYQFFWHEFCDWYLEFIKPNLYGRVERWDREATREVLYETFLTLLKLLHPFMPFITEELYQRLPAKGEESIMVSSFPKRRAEYVDLDKEESMQVLKDVISLIRNIRGELRISPQMAIEVFIRTPTFEHLLSEYAFYIKEFCRLEAITFGDWGTKAASATTRGVEIFVPVERYIDIERELMRIEKEMRRTEELIARLDCLLRNPSFMERAESQVIEEKRLEFLELEEKRSKLLSLKRMLLGE